MYRPWPAGIGDFTTEITEDTESKFFFLRALRVLRGEV